MRYSINYLDPCRALARDQTVSLTLLHTLNIHDITCTETMRKGSDIVLTCSIQQGLRLCPEQAQYSKGSDIVLTCSNYSKGSNCVLKMLNTARAQTVSCLTMLTCSLQQGIRLCPYCNILNTMGSDCVLLNTAKE